MFKAIKDPTDNHKKESILEELEKLLKEQQKKTQLEKKSRVCYPKEIKALAYEAFSKNWISSQELSKRSGVHLQTLRVWEKKSKTPIFPCSKEPTSSFKVRELKLEPAPFFHMATIHLKSQIKIEIPVSALDRKLFQILQEGGNF